MRISDWSSDVCSSDLLLRHFAGGVARLGIQAEPAAPAAALFLLGLGLRIHARLVRGCVPLGEREAPRIRAGSIGAARLRHPRSEERRVGKECVSTCRSRWAPYHKKKKNKTQRKHQKTKE